MVRAAKVLLTIASMLLGAFVLAGTIYAVADIRRQPPPVPLSELTPLPGGLEIIGHSSGCGNGFDPADCGLNVVVSAIDGRSKAEIVNALRHHLQARGWKLQQAGDTPVSFKQCTRRFRSFHWGSYCVEVSDFQAALDEFSIDQPSTLKSLGIVPQDLNQPLAVVIFSTT
jgi:hypothetical protein